MPIVQMPDGTNVSFPDEMGAEKIRGLISQKFPQEASALSQPAVDAGITTGPEDPNEVTGRFTFLPIGVTRSDKAVMALPQFAVGPRQTIIDILEGRRTPDQISGQEIFELGALFSPTGAASRAGSMAKSAATQTPPGPVIEAARNIGVDLPKAVASESSVVQQAGKVASNIPIGGQPIRAASQKAITQLDDATTRVEAGFGAGSPQRAGIAAEQGITSFAGNKGVLSERVAAKYEAVDNIVDPAVTRELGETIAVADKILARRSNARITQPSEAVKRVEEAMTTPGGLNYKGTFDLRSYIGELLGNPSLLPSDISGAELKQIYGALSKDLRAVAEQAGGQKGLRAFEFANRSAEKTAKLREDLSRVLKAASEEAIFAKIEAFAGSNSRSDIKSLAQVRAAVGKDNWDEIASAVIHKMGRDSEGNLTPDRLISSWGKLSPMGKKVLFRTTGKDSLANSLDDIVKVSSKFKQLNQFANPSGTGQTVIGAGIGTGLILDPVTAATSVIGARLLSSVLARPATAKPMANWSKAYELAVRNPTKEVSRIFKERSQILAESIAAELGIPQSAARLANEFGGAIPIKADQNQE